MKLKVANELYFLIEPVHLKALCQKSSQREALGYHNKAGVKIPREPKSVLLFLDLMTIQLLSVKMKKRL